MDKIESNTHSKYMGYESHYKIYFNTSHATWLQVFQILYCYVKGIIIILYLECLVCDYISWIHLMVIKNGIIYS